MGTTVQPIGDLVTDNNTSMEELIKLQEIELNKQLETIYSVKKKQSLGARYIYGFIFFATNLLTWFIRDYGYKFLHGLHLCRIEQADCFHAGGVLRVSFGCFIFFSIMFVSTFGASKLNEIRNIWHSRFWIAKFLLYIMSLIIPFVIPKALIQIYGEIARIGAGIFLILQLISMLEFISWCNHQWMPDPQSKKCGFFGLFLSTISYVTSFAGIFALYFMYAPNLSCTLNLFSITWTSILVIVMMLVSLHSKVNEGLLSSGIMGLYIVYLCWSAIQSEPHNGKCYSKWKSGVNGDWSTIVGFLIAICSIVMSTFSTGIDTQSFQFQKDRVQLEDGVPYSYGIFHFVFAMGSMYFAMLFISWELDHPTKKWSIDVGWASTWVKIINEWFAASIYLWKLISPVMIKNNEEFTQNVHLSV